MGRGTSSASLKTFHRTNFFRARIIKKNQNLENVNLPPTGFSPTKPCVCRDWGMAHTGWIYVLTSEEEGSPKEEKTAALVWF